MTKTTNRARRRVLRSSKSRGSRDNDVGKRLTRRARRRLDTALERDGEDVAVRINVARLEAGESQYEVFMSDPYTGDQVATLIDCVARWQQAKRDVQACRITGLSLASVRLDVFAALRAADIPMEVFATMLDGGQS